MKKRNVYYLGLVVLGVVARFLPHPPNFTPTGAIAFFSGSKLRGPMAYLIPLLILAISDLVFGWHSTMLYVYCSFLVTVALGRRLQGSNVIKGTGLALSSVLFFAVTNFGVWFGSGFYPASAAGLLACYTAALPFFFNELASTLLYGGAFFFIASYIEKKIPVAESAAV